MCEQTEITELHKIYQEMDTEGRKKITVAASQLLKAQESFEDNQNDAQLPEHKADRLAVRNIIKGEIQ
jgi:hypothetical protein